MDLLWLLVEGKIIIDDDANLLRQNSQTSGNHHNHPISLDNKDDEKKKQI